MGNLFYAHHLEKTSYPTFSAYYYRQWKNYEMDFHKHDSIEMMYVINGHCEIELLESGSLKPIVKRLKKGEFILLDGRVSHRLLVRDEIGCRMLNIEFTFQPAEYQLPAIASLADEDEDLQYLLQHAGAFFVLRDIDEVYSTLKALVLELDNKQSGRSLKRELLFTQLIVLVAKLFKASLCSAEQSSGALHYVREVLNDIHQHYDGDITVASLARSVNVHPNYLHRIFRAETGMTIVSYLNRYRMEKAMMLLRETDIPVAHICEYVGVNSRVYFHDLFKKHTSLTPMQYREKSNRQHYNNEEVRKG
ncbi:MULTISPECIES: AraC family transcriptional regulator [Paenibacillus]|uniref:AraC family transcriptional regulator n=1 Tax=Paenibacillus TaxID=44249 RepID=UPI00203B6E23|nr:AraC family transcriptional regulator [Paenibacillus camelliae]MCM3632372.1 AraC family transcriptional regulator [Paenibacillus camelliae]